MFHRKVGLDATPAGHCPSAPVVRSAGLDGAEYPDWFVGEWKRLEARASWPTQCHAFVASLAPLIASRPAIALFLERPGGMSALLPLCRHRGYFARWHIAGAEDLFEPGDILCDGPQEAWQLARAIAAMHHPLSLDRISAASPLVPALRAAIKGKGWVSVRPAMPCPLIALDDAWKEPECRFNPRRRSDFRRAMRRAESFGAVSFETITPSPEQFEALFDEAVGVELLGWKHEAGSAIASDPGRLEFFRRFFRSNCAEGCFHVSFMRIDGKAMAMQLAITWSGRYWLFKIGHDAQFNKCSPGTLLMLHTLRWAAERNLRGYELLGEAEDWITRLWTQDEHECVHLRTYPFSLRGTVALIADGSFWLRQRLARKR